MLCMAEERDGAEGQSDSQVKYTKIGKDVRLLFVLIVVLRPCYPTPGTPFDLLDLADGHGLLSAQDYSAHRLLGSTCLLHRGACHWWRTCGSKRSHHSVCRSSFSSPATSMIRLPISHGLFRTATHHNMMLDPAVLCASSRFVIIASNYPD